MLWSLRKRKAWKRASHTHCLQRFYYTSAVLWLYIYICSVVSKKKFFFFLFSFIFNTCIEMVVLLLFFIAFIRNICSTELSKLMYYPCIEQDIDLCYARKAGGNLVERPICYSIAQPEGQFFCDSLYCC